MTAPARYGTAIYDESTMTSVYVRDTVGIYRPVGWARAVPWEGADDMALAGGPYGYSRSSG
jgi:hypothetical protein